MLITGSFLWDFFGPIESPKCSGPEGNTLQPPGSTHSWHEPTKGTLVARAPFLGLSWGTSTNLIFVKHTYYHTIQQHKQSVVSVVWLWLWFWMKYNDISCELPTIQNHTKTWHAETNMRLRNLIRSSWAPDFGVWIPILP